MNRTIANKKKIREIPSNSLNYFVTQFYFESFYADLDFLAKFQHNVLPKTGHWTLFSPNFSFFEFLLVFVRFANMAVNILVCGTSYQNCPHGFLIDE